MSKNVARCIWNKIRNCSTAEALDWCQESGVTRWFHETRANRPFSGHEKIQIVRNHSAYKSGCVPTEMDVTAGYFIPSHYVRNTFSHKFDSFIRFIFGGESNENLTIKDKLDSIILFILLPLFFILFLSLSAFQLAIFRRQQVKSRKMRNPAGEKVYIHQFCLTITDLVSVTGFFTGLYCQNFNWEYAAGCTFARYVPWRILSHNLILISGIQLTGITLDRIDGMRRPVKYFVRVRPGRRAAWISLAAYGFPVLLSYAMLAEQTTSTDYLLSADSVHSLAAVNPSVTRLLNQLEWQGNGTGELARQIQLCTILYYFREAEQTYPDVSTLAFMPQRCFYFINKPSPRNTMIIVGTACMLTVALSLLGIWMACLHRRLKIESAKIRNQSKMCKKSKGTTKINPHNSPNSKINPRNASESKINSRIAPDSKTNPQHAPESTAKPPPRQKQQTDPNSVHSNNVIVYSVTIQTVIQALFTASVSLLYLHTWEMSVCHWRWFGGGGSGSGGHSFVCSQNFWEILSISLGFVSYYQNFFVFVALSKTFRREFLEMINWN